MCLGIPAQIVEIVDLRAKTAKAEIGGVRRIVSCALLDGEAQVGEWVLIHVGFALDRIDEEEACETLQLLSDMGEAYEREQAQIRASSKRDEDPSAGRDRWMRDKDAGSVRGGATDATEDEASRRRARPGGGVLRFEGSSKAGEEAGFTLIELLVVIVIIGVLIAIAVVSYLGFSDRASRTAARANVRTVVPAMTAFYTEHATYAGATLTSLREAYDLQIDDSAASHYKISNMSDSSYCLQNHVGDWYAWTTGPNEPIDSGSAGHC